METQFATRDKVLEPLILLRRPLPPKFLPALNLPSPKASRPAELISKGKRPLKEGLLTDEGKALAHLSDESRPHSAVEMRSIAYTGWICEQRAPTPATSRVTNLDLDHCSYDPGAQRHVHHKHANTLPEPILKGSSVSPFKHSGPEDFMPHRSHLRPLTQLQNLLEPYFETLPEFTLDVASLQSSFRAPVIETLPTPYKSPLHYNALMKLLHDRLQQSKQTKVNILSLSSKSIPETKPRVPQRQILLEEKLKHALSLEEDETGFAGRLNEARESQFISLKELQNLRNVHSGAESITPAQLAVFECLVNGGLSLNLKAFFIDRLPDLTLIYHTLVCVNLSFNDFQRFPPELYDIENLEVLKMRNNPIKVIPNDIHRLRKLKCLIMSFCLLSALPPGLFLLAHLEILDVSYNEISSIPNDICNLSFLRFLNVEGNQLPALPCGALKLRLKQLRVSNNMMHPLLWSENCWIKPQRLKDLAALALSRSRLEQCSDAIPKKAEHILSNFTVCDCCKMPMYGKGFRLIRPCKKIFGVFRVPFLFSSCSPSCYENFMSQKESLAESLYGNMPETEGGTIYQ